MNNYDTYTAFKNFSDSRETITNSTNNKLLGAFKQLYLLSDSLYRLLNFSPISSERNQHDITKENKLISAIQENIVYATDLVNLKQFNSASNNYRSIIESTFRLLLLTEKCMIEAKILNTHHYSKDESQKKIKRLIDTHKVGKLTSFTSEYFKDYIVGTEVLYLNSLYSEFSKTIHTDLETKSSILYLMALEQQQDELILDKLHLFSDSLKNIIIVIYYSLNHFFNTQSLSSQEFAFITQIYRAVPFQNKLQNISAST